MVEIESLMFDEHELIKRAATECMCNMIMCQEVSCLSQPFNFLVCPAVRFLARILSLSLGANPTLTLNLTQDRAGRLCCMCSPLMSSIQFYLGAP